MRHALNFRVGLAVTVVVTALAGCSAGSVAQRGEKPRGYLRIEVKPESAELEIDEVYNGVANGWVEGVVPVSPGVRRLTLRAKGYITQRFDIEVASYEEVTLIVSLEPELDLPDDSVKEPPNPFRPTLRPAVE